ncbi:MAG: hypothetical protein CVV24_02190 [Ignavibacteriae bacterium HGW-Ignavibacteriae-3]|nr:MAG: hypothetical protein CVV24_02190 [Ignavibacteriae bacterium HGW-Ignavibacteriae-3]
MEILPFAAISLLNISHVEIFAQTVFQSRFNIVRSINQYGYIIGTFLKMINALAKKTVLIGGKISGELLTRRY